MIFTTKTIALVATLLSVTSASPIASPVTPGKREHALKARAASETLYLVNCSGGNEGTQSQMNYYSNGRTGSQHGEQPNAVAVVASNGMVTWEGRAVTGAFGGNNGGTATSHIQSNGQQVGNYNYAGTATNSFGQNFNCYKDDGHVLHNGAGDPNFTCRSIYYCEDVSMECKSEARTC